MRIGVIGCAGRMGRANLREVLGTPGATLAGGVERPGHEALGQDLGVLAGVDPVGVPATADVPGLIGAAHAVIEFSTPEATLANAALCAEQGRAHVVGTTGLSPAQERELRRHAERAAIVWAPNMSLGVNLLLGLVEQVARALDADYDIEILEMHHRHKVDAPSGTALALGRAAGRRSARSAAAAPARPSRSPPPGSASGAPGARAGCTRVAARAAPRRPGSPRSGRRGCRAPRA
jgi:4-hydroxy-tetrahydrodipicolinate reductase